MKIYTKTGDDGTTGLFDGSRISKASLRVEVYGTVDELNSIIGILTTLELHSELQAVFAKLNSLLFTLGTDLATPFNTKRKTNRIGSEDIFWLEGLIDDYTTKMPPLKNFILPGGTTAAAYLHNARTVCRRAERRAVELSKAEDLGEYVIIFMNRLSDFLFTAARYANHLTGVGDVLWKGYSD